MASHEDSAVVIELLVRNHPGTMSHITGLFARRTFNLEAIICVPVGDGTRSDVLLLVASSPRLEQMELQLLKLHDVLRVRHRRDIDPAAFRGIATLMGMCHTTAPTAPPARELEKLPA